MRNLLIIGSGQLGSRHLQGALKVEEKLNFYVLDPSEKSLEIAQSRANEINHDHKISFVTKWTELPASFEVVIVATSANVRAKVVTQLLENHKVSFLILEKVLFQDIESYERIYSLIQKTNTNTFVNHPRRTFDFYKQIKKDFSASNDKRLLMQVAGGNWGLACNALHFIDMFSFFTNSNLREVNTDLLDNAVLESKRDGYIEFSGTLTGVMESGDSFTVSAFDEPSSDITVSLVSNSNRWFINEGREKELNRLSFEKGFKSKLSKISISFQSDLTNDLVTDLLTNGGCELTPFIDASKMHVVFIKALLNKYKEITNHEITNCLIT